jgi:hypothetical protein
VDPIFLWIEDSGLSRWVTGEAFPWILVAHTVGVGLVAGPNAAVALRILGAARAVPLRAMAGFAPVVWLGLLANVPSGVLLLIGYPTKALTNPVFYLKLACIGLGLALMMHVQRTVLLPAGDAAERAQARAKVLAWATLALWAGAITAGRLLAYTHSRLTASSPL